jgi:hypothetical protein
MVGRWFEIPNEINEVKKVGFRPYSFNVNIRIRKGGVGDQNIQVQSFIVYK